MSAIVYSSICVHFIGKYLTPIHEAITPTKEMEEIPEQEADTVFYSETSHPENDRSTTQLLPPHSKYSSISLANGASDSGITSSDHDSSNTSTNCETMEQPVVFTVTILPEESTEC